MTSLAVRSTLAFSLLILPAIVSANGVFLMPSLFFPLYFAQFQGDNIQSIKMLSDVRALFHNGL